MCTYSHLLYLTLGPYCNQTWDGIMCWPTTEAGETAEQSCPSYVHGFDLSGAQKYLLIDIHSTVYSSIVIHSTPFSSAVIHSIVFISAVIHSTVFSSAVIHSTVFISSVIHSTVFSFIVIDIFKQIILEITEHDAG